MKIRTDVVTAEHLVFSDDVDVLVAPGVDGQLGILPHHIPLIALLSPGELVLKKNGEETSLAIGSGYLEVTPDQIIILVDSAERAEEINVARAEAAKRRAQERLRTASPNIDRERAEAALRRALARLEVASTRTKAKPRVKSTPDSK